MQNRRGSACPSFWTIIKAVAAVCFLAPIADLVVRGVYRSKQLREVTERERSCSELFIKHGNSMIQQQYLEGSIRCLDDAVDATRCRVALCNALAHNNSRYKRKRHHHNKHKPSHHALGGVMKTESLCNTSNQNPLIFSDATDLSKHDIKISSETKTVHLHAEKGFRIFRHFPFPKANQAFPKGNHNIVIHCVNVSDGIGDWVHANRLAKKTIQIAKENGYNLIGILEVDVDVGKRMIDILHTIAKQLETHCFDKIYVVFQYEEYFELMKGLKEVQSSAEIEYDKAKAVFKKFNLKNVVLKQNAKDDDLLSDLKSACLDLTIYSAVIEKTEFPENVPRIKISEYSCDVSSNNWIAPYSFRVANMGLVKITNDRDCFGIPLNDFKKFSKKEKAERLFQFKGQHLVRLLLNKEIYDPAAAELYFDEHRLFPGYLQSFGTVNLFISIHVYQYMEERILTQNCDFYLNNGYVDADSIKAILKELGIQEKSIQFITPESTVQSFSENSTPQVRVFSGFRLDDLDHQDMYRLTEDGAACSGDNSASDVFSSFNVPFAMQTLPGSSHFILKFFSFFPKFLEGFKKSQDNPELLYKKLYEYFDILCNQESINMPLKDFFSEDLYVKEHIKITKMLGRLLRDPTLRSEWESFRKMLVSEYNFTENYKIFILKERSLLQVMNSVSKNCLAIWVLSKNSWNRKS